MERGVIVKLILNLILVPIETIGVNGAAIGSVACHIVAFTISIIALKSSLKISTNITKFVIKPLIAVGAMAIGSYYTFLRLEGIFGNNIAIIIAMVIAVVIYTSFVIGLKIFTKEEILSLPKGNNIYKCLEKLKIY